MRVLRIVSGILCILVGIALAVYLGVWVFLIGGVENIIDGAKATPTDGGLIVWGLAEVCILAELTATVAFWVGIGFGVGMITSAKR